MTPFQILGIGEVLWDMLPAGKQLGGAPANFVCHAHALSPPARLISRVGGDAAGREILDFFTARGLSTDTIAVDADAPTGTVSIEVSAEGQPAYTIHQGVAWDRLEANREALDAATRADAICFGTLAQRTPRASEALEKLLAASRPEAWRVFDINLRAPFIDGRVIERSLRLANVLKLNEHELPVLAEQFHLKGDAGGQMAALAERFSLRLVALTRGAGGCALFAHGLLLEQPGAPATVRDTVGAGDAFTAALVAGLLRDWPLEEIGHQANAVAAFVCSQPGATPPLPDELRAPFTESALPIS